VEKLFNVGVKGIIHASEGYILLRKVLDNGESFWDVPGGRINGDEGFETTLRRELVEELPGINIRSVGGVEGVFRVSKDIKKDTGLVLLYHTVEADFANNEIEISDEHESLLLVKTKEDLPTEGLNSVVANILTRKLE
jgi:ADP-ribose pyrophosphatase YjhB (NUDIX family)